MYALFGYDQYYPQGGWNDHMGTFASVEEAKTHVKGRDYYQIVDLRIGNILDQFDIPFDNDDPYND